MVKREKAGLAAGRRGRRYAEEEEIQANHHDVDYAAADMLGHVGGRMDDAVVGAFLPAELAQRDYTLKPRRQRRAWTDEEVEYVVCLRRRLQRVINI